MSDASRLFAKLGAALLDRESSPGREMQSRTAKHSSWDKEDNHSTGLGGGNGNGYQVLRRHLEAAISGNVESSQDKATIVPERVECDNQYIGRIAGPQYKLYKRLPLASVRTGAWMQAPASNGFQKSSQWPKTDQDSRHCRLGAIHEAILLSPHFPDKHKSSASGRKPTDSPQETPIQTSAPGGPDSGPSTATVPKSSLCESCRAVVTCKVVSENPDDDCVLPASVTRPEGREVALMVLQDTGADVSAMCKTLAEECGAEITELAQTERIRNPVGDRYVDAKWVARLDVQLPCLVSKGKPPVKVEFYLLDEKDFPAGEVLLGRQAVRELGHTIILHCEVCAEAK